MAGDDLETASAPAEGRWSFDERVTEAFDDMLERSIPNYGDMRDLTTEAVSWTIAQRSWMQSVPNVVDIGCSRGSALAPIIQRHGVLANYFAYDVSEPMLDACRARFKPMIDARAMVVANRDLRVGFPPVHRAATVILSVLTLQFVPIEYRQEVLRGAYRALEHGGSLILVERVLGEAAESSAMMTDLYYGMKRLNGYTQEAIDRKRFSLEGVLVPLTAKMNEQWLRDAGFGLVEQVWGWANFRGWWAVKR